MKLSEEQIDFLECVTSVRSDVLYFECYPEYRNTAMILYKKGLIEFLHNKLPENSEIFFCKISKKGRRYNYDTLNPNNST